jgi:hypothetical protein
MRYDHENNRPPTSYLKGSAKRTGGGAHTITLEEYKALEAAGKINRPLTDYPMEVKKHNFKPNKAVGIIDQIIANHDKD